MDPWGAVLAQSQFQTDNEPVIVALKLDNRPQYYEWPEEVRKSGPYPDPYQRGLQPAAKGDLRALREKIKPLGHDMGLQPAAKGDLRAVLLNERRPGSFTSSHGIASGALVRRDSAFRFWAIFRREERGVLVQEDFTTDPAENHTPRDGG